MWKSLGDDIFTIKNKHYLYVVDYHIKFPVVMWLKGLSAGNIIKTCKIIFLVYGLPSKILSDVGTNFVSYKFEDFCR